MLDARKFWLLATSSLVAGMLVAPAHAQEVSEAASSGDSAIGEIIVTAQKRSENVQKASISIDVLSAQEIKDGGVAQVVDLGRIAPGVQVAQGGTAAQVYIRGAGDFSTTSFNDAAVVQNFDGVAAGRSQYMAGTYFDLERIEVLRGPQGTLYGRNAIGGVLNVLPVQPKLGELSGYASASYQNYDGYLLEGAINVPIGAKGALRVSGQLVNREGYISDGSNDDVHESVRVQLKTQPTDRLTIRVLGNYQHAGGVGPGKVAYAPTAPAFPGATAYMPNDPWESFQGLTNQYLSLLPPALGAIRIDTRNQYQNNTAWGASANIDYDLGIGTLTVIPAYQRVELDSLTYPTLTFYTKDLLTGAITKSDTYSFESRLAGQNDRLKWVLGGFYFRENQNSANTIRIGAPADFVQDAKLSTESYAFFGDATFTLRENFRLIGGLRYTKETKTVDGAGYNLTQPGRNCGTPFACPTPVIAGGYAGNRLNYRAGFEFDVSPDNMLYATVATAFKSGGQVYANLDPYKPEDLTAYTFGSKNRFFDGKVQLNAEFFYYKFKDHQEKITKLDRSNLRISALVNAGDAESKGVNLDLIVKPTSTTQLHAGVEYLDAKYGSFVYQEYQARSPAASTGCTVTPIANGNVTVGFWNIDCSGRSMPRAPKWSGSVGIDQTFELGDAGRLVLSSSMTFASGRWLHAYYVPNTWAKSYQVYDVSLTYFSPGDRFKVQGFVRNLSNAAVYTGAEQNAFVGNLVGADISAPRTYGVRVTYDF